MRIKICVGATISAAEVERVHEAMDKLEADKGAAHEMTVHVTLHLHHEYPKMLYKGKEAKSVADSDAEAAAIEDGFASYDHESFTKEA